MYELTCPSCQAKRQQPFVRVGAIAVCPSCSHRYQIAESQVRRRVETLDPQAPNPLLFGRRAPAPPAQPTHEQPPPPPPDDNLDDPTPPPHVTAPSRPVAEARVVDPEPDPVFEEPSADDSVDEGRPRSLESGKWVVWGGLAAVVVVIAAVLGLYIAGRWPKSPDTKGGPTPSAPQDPITVVDTPPAPAPVLDDLPLIPAEALDVGDWEFVSGDLPEPSSDSRISVRDEELRPNYGRDYSTFRADLIVEPGPVIERARAIVHVHGADGHVVARTEMPIGLQLPLRPNEQPPMFTVRVPNRYFDNPDSVTVGQIKVYFERISELEHGARLTQLSSEPQEIGSKTSLVIESFNNEPETTGRIVFLAQAVTVRGSREVVGQWQCVWDEPVEPREAVRFRMLLSTQGIEEQVKFRVVGAFERQVSDRDRVIDSEDGLAP